MLSLSTFGSLGRILVGHILGLVVAATVPVGVRIAVRVWVSVVVGVVGVILRLCWVRLRHLDVVSLDFLFCLFTK